MDPRARFRRGRNHHPNPFPGVPTAVFSLKCLLGFAAALHGVGLLLYLLQPETPEKIRVRHARGPPAEDFANWLEETTHEQRHALWQAHAPPLPLARRVDDPAAALDAAQCGSWFGHYLAVHRSTRGRNHAPVLVPPPDNSRGVGDWETQALRLARGAIANGAPVFVDWPAAFATDNNPDGALAPVSASVEALYRPSRHAQNALSPRDFDGWQALSPEAAPPGPAADACVLGLLLPPSDRALARTAATRAALADPHALTLGLHVRTGFADGHPDRRSRSSAGEEADAAGARARAADEWRALVEGAVDCALALEEQWQGDRPRVVWLLVSDGEAGSSRPDAFGKAVKALLAQRGRLLRPKEEGGGPARALVTGRRGAGRGLHTGPAFQHSDAARAVSEGSSSSSSKLGGEGESGGDGSSALGAGYALVVGAALDDQLLLASCDFVVAASGHVVPGTSAFARGAAQRGGHSADSVFATAKPGDGGQCAPVARL